MDSLRQTLDSALSSNYRIERELGGGGMSRVFLAEEVSLKRQVVIKVLPPELAAQVSADRFRREIQVAAQLQHPHIVPVHSAGAAGELLWFVMPFLEGASLRERLARGALPPADAVRIWREVLDGLSFAHNAGVVHRDIKPENILLSGRHASITDFGVASAVQAASGEERVTMTGTVLGTPAYMAPEQAAADAHIDHRADLYAAGLVMYEMLSGAAPFKGLSAREMLVAHVTKDPPALSEVQPLVPDSLSALVMRCLAKDPGARPANADAVLAELDRIVTPTMVSPMAGVLPASRTRRPFVIAAAVAAVLVAVGAWGVGTGKFAMGPPAPPAHDSLRLRVITVGLQSDAADSTLARRVRDAALAELETDPWLFVVKSSVIAQNVSLLGLDPLTMSTPDSLRALGRRLRTHVFVDFGVSRVSNGYLLTAEARGARQDNSLGVVSEAAAGPEEIPAAMERLATTLRARIVAARGSVPPTEFSLTVAAALPAAVEQYIEAQSDISRRNWLDAARRAGNAVRLDSMFVDAYMVRYLALANAGVQVHERTLALAAAYRLRESIGSPMIRAMLEATYARATGDDAGALAAYNAAARLLPAGSGGINDLGLVYSALRRPDEATREYRRSIDTSYRYMTVVNTNLVASLITLGRMDEAAAELARMERSDPTHGAVLAAHYRLASARRDWEEAGRLGALRLSLAENFSDTLFSIAWIRLAELNRGRLVAFDSLARSRAGRLQDAASEGDFLGAELERARVHAVVGGDSARARAIVDSVLAATPWASMPALERPHAAMIRYLAAVGDVRRGEEIVIDWSRSTPAEFKRRDSLAVLSARGELALAAGDGREALRLTRLADVRGCVPCVFPQYARAFDRLGQRDSAKVYFERYASATMPASAALDGLELAHTYLRLGELNEDLKRGAEAMRWYERFVALWATADTPALRAKVVEVRARIARLQQPTR